MPSQQASEQLPVLIILSGLPGVGKTTIARRLARLVGAFHLRIDSIEEALMASWLKIDSAENAGYLAAYRVAEDNLFGGQIVIADSVNPIEETRQAWRGVALACNARAIEVDVVCSDAALHRASVETRRSGPDGDRQPAWQDVLDREFDALPGNGIVIDTALADVYDAVKRIADEIHAS